MKKFFMAIGRFFKKLGFSIVKFFVLTFKEMKRLRWPTKEIMRDASRIVLSFILLFGLYIVLDNYIIAQVLKLMNY